jgi:hypothetical protein
MTPSLRKFTLTVHVASSVALLGSIAVFLLLAITAVTTQDAQIIRASYPAMDLTARLVIVPLALASLLSGLVQSLGTPWGLFRHYWIVAKLLITVFATIILLAKLALIEYAASLAAAPLPGIELQGIGMELAVHAAGGLLVLLVPTALSIYKPKGLTPFGLRRQQLKQQLKPSSSATDRSPKRSSVDGVAFGPGGALITVTLRRAHLYGIIVLVVVLHIVIVHASGIGLHGH